jgi:hypothetical protein
MLAYEIAYPVKTGRPQMAKNKSQVPNHKFKGGRDKRETNIRGKKFQTILRLKNALFQQ